MFDRQIRSRRTLISATLMLAAIPVATGATAGALSDVTIKNGAKQVRVSYGDLNIASADGAAALRARIATASRIVCGPVGYRLDLSTQARFEACLQEAERSALTGLNIANAGTVNVGRE